MFSSMKQAVVSLATEYLPKEWYEAFIWVAGEQCHFKKMSFFISNFTENIVTSCQMNIWPQ